jgi:hypothetical protein
MGQAIIIYKLSRLGTETEIIENPGSQSVPIFQELARYQNGYLFGPVFVHSKVSNKFFVGISAALNPGELFGEFWDSMDEGETYYFQLMSGTCGDAVVQNALKRIGNEKNKANK